MLRTRLDSIAALLAPGRLVKELLEGLGMSIELLFENMQALEAVFANGNKLSMKSLKGFERANFGHGQEGPVEDWRISIASGRAGPPRFVDVVAMDLGQSGLQQMWGSICRSSNC